jgi:hypothetical protein
MALSFVWITTIIIHRISMLFMGEDEAWININTLAIFSGSLPSRALGLVIEWASMHQDELRHDWELARKQQKPEKIKPLK